MLGLAAVFWVVFAATILLIATRCPREQRRTAICLLLAGMAVTGLIA